LLKEAQREKEVSEDKLIEYTDTMVKEYFSSSAAITCSSAAELII